MSHVKGFAIEYNIRLSGGFVMPKLWYEITACFFCDFHGRSFQKE
jgi:hypothetical protein